MKSHHITFITILLSVFYTQALSQTKDTGVLILAHGGSDGWNKMVAESVAPLRQQYPVAIAYGMADPITLEAGLRELEAKKVKEVVVVPLFISSHSFILRQTEYLLGKRQELADPLIIMNHSGGNDGHPMHASGHSEPKEKAAPDPIQTSLKIHITRALDDHEIVAKILDKRIKSLSHDPAHETIILVGHGPNPEADNRNWVASMESLADKIKDMNRNKGLEFKNILALTVRDDASTEIYDLAKENLRSIIRQCGKNSSVIVVPLLLSKGGIEKGIVERMQGLNYVWSGETLLPDPLITDFISQSVELALTENSTVTK